MVCMNFLNIRSWPEGSHRYTLLGNADVYCRTACPKDLQLVPIWYRWLQGWYKWLPIAELMGMAQLVWTLDSLTVPASMAGTK